MHGMHVHACTLHLVLFLLFPPLHLTTTILVLRIYLLDCVLSRLSRPLVNAWKNVICPACGGGFLEEDTAHSRQHRAAIRTHEQTHRRAVRRSTSIDFLLYRHFVIRICCKWNSSNQAIQKAESFPSLLLHLVAPKGQLIQFLIQELIFLSSLSVVGLCH